VICGGEALQPDDCVQCELPHAAASVHVLWELHDSVRRIPDPNCLFTRRALRLCPYTLPTRGPGWLRELP